uniref:Uncharacterized protein n=1 Tax=Cacopsylla melanoneura TaxID=428564 RepID=A0A8D9AHN4_9HEMI
MYFLDILSSHLPKKKKKIPTIFTDNFAREKKPRRTAAVATQTQHTSTGRDTTLLYATQHTKSICRYRQQDRLSQTEILKTQLLYQSPLAAEFSNSGKGQNTGKVCEKKSDVEMEKQSLSMSLSSSLPLFMYPEL